MNIFRLNNDPVLAAQDYQDLHVIKICLEATQLLANCYSKESLEKAPKTQAGNVRKYSHVHHPISVWTKESSANFEWALKHGIALCNEFEYRFGKKHFCETFIDWCKNNKSDLIFATAETEQPQCFKQHPDCVVSGDPVAGYRNYYKKSKMSFVIRDKIVVAQWTKRSNPAWL